MTKKEKYDMRKAAGLCVSCGKPAAEGKVICGECADKRNKYKKELYEWRKSIGICTQCGKNPAYKGGMCLVCKQDHAEWNRAHGVGKSDKERQQRKISSKALYEQRKSEGKCPKCGRKLPKDCKTVYCNECRNRAKRNERDRRQAKDVIPDLLRGNGEYCAICRHPVENKGLKLCNRCHENCTKNLVKARAAIPYDCYMRKAIAAQWRDYEARKDKYNEC